MLDGIYELGNPLALVELENVFSHENPQDAKSKLTKHEYLQKLAPLSDAAIENDFSTASLMKN